MVMNILIFYLIFINLSYSELRDGVRQRNSTLSIRQLITQHLKSKNSTGIIDNDSCQVCDPDICNERINEEYDLHCLRIINDCKFYWQSSIKGILGFS